MTRRFWGTELKDPDEIQMAETVEKLEKSENKKREKNYNVFMAKLTRLSLMHGVHINSCGCCGGPFLSDHDKDSVGKYTFSDGGDNIEWVPDKGDIDKH